MLFLLSVSLPRQWKSSCWRCSKGQGLPFPPCHQGQCLCSSGPAPPLYCARCPEGTSASCHPHNLPGTARERGAKGKNASNALRQTTEKIHHLPKSTPPSIVVYSILFSQYNSGQRHWYQRTDHFWVMVTQLDGLFEWFQQSNSDKWQAMMSALYTCMNMIKWKWACYCKAYYKQLMLIRQYRGNFSAEMIRRQHVVTE